MKFSTGRVVNGQVVVEDGFLEEGATVAILAREADETFTLAAPDAKELQRRLDEIRSGDFVEEKEVLQDLLDSK